MADCPCGDEDFLRQQDIYYFVVNRDDQVGVAPKPTEDAEVAKYDQEAEIP
ncbi:MAG: hypothetical protein AAB360_02975 [Patescibacteria group bacterium]